MRVHDGAFAARRRARRQGGGGAAAPQQLPPDFYNRVMNDTSIPHELKVQILQRAQAAMGHDAGAVGQYMQTLYDPASNLGAAADEFAHGGTWGQAFDYAGAPVGGFRFDANGQPYDPNAPAPAAGAPAPAPPPSPAGIQPALPRQGMQASVPPGVQGSVANGPGAYQTDAYVDGHPYVPPGLGQNGGPSDMDQDDMALNPMSAMMGGRQAFAGGRMGSEVAPAAPRPSMPPGNQMNSMPQGVAGATRNNPFGNQLGQGPRQAPAGRTPQIQGGPGETDDAARSSFLQFMQRQGLGRR